MLGHTPILEVPLHGRESPPKAHLLDVLQADAPGRSGDEVYEPIAVVNRHL